VSLTYEVVMLYPTMSCCQLLFGVCFSLLDAHGVAELCMLLFVICNELGCFDAITKLLCCHNTYDVCGFFTRCT
jgi:hypothetical protein